MKSLSLQSFISHPDAPPATRRRTHASLEIPWWKAMLPRRPAVRTRRARWVLLCSGIALFAPLAAAEETTPTPVMLSNAPGPDQFVRCLMPVQIRDTEVLSDRHIVFYTRGDRRYLVEFPQGCGGLRKDASFRIQARGNGYCQHDTVQPLTLASPGSGFWGTPCPVPGFRPVTEAQVKALKSETPRGK